MKNSIKISRSYFSYTWQLVCQTPKKTCVFFLGQDEKVCRRLLGMTSEQVIQEIGTKEIGEGTVGNKRLANLIVDYLDLNGHNIDKFESWAFAVE